MAYLYRHHNQQAGLGHQCKGLVVSNGLPITSHCIVHGPIGDEEKNEGTVDPLQHALDKHYFVKIEVLLARHV